MRYNRDSSLTILSNLFVTHGFLRKFSLCYRESCTFRFKSPRLKHNLHFPDARHLLREPKFYINLRLKQKNMEYLSRERYDEISAELDKLMNVTYPQIRDELCEARAQGDLSENAEYKAARAAQARTISRIKFLQKVLQFSKIIDTSTLPKDRVTLLSKVEFTHLGLNKKMAYTLVSHHEMNLEAGKLSCNSPIGQALMGKKVGNIVDVKAPAGSFQIRIDSVLPPE